MKLTNIFHIFSRDLAIDLGTANTLVYAQDEGIIINEPSVVAIRKTMSTGADRVLAVGSEAKKMLGRTPGSIVAIRPMRDGVIADFEVTQAMLKYFIQRVQKRPALLRPRIVIAVPFGITQVEKRAVREAAESAGAREVYLIEEPMAAAIGAGLPVTEPTGNMIVDIGGGTTEVAVISLGGIVQSSSIKIAGDSFDDALIQYMKRQYNLLIGERTAELIKITIGNAHPFPEKKFMDVKGRDLIGGAPRTVQVHSEEIRDALSEPIAAVVDSIRITLEKTPPELAADIVDHGIMLTGGGSLLSNFDQLIRSKTDLPVTIADDPLTSVVYGAGKVLSELDLLRQIQIQ
ncbi:rod shape-determining protein [Bdellovibrionota bacterium]